MSQRKPAPQSSASAWTRNTGPANAARRGVRLHDPGSEWPGTRKRLAKALQEPVRGLVSAVQCSEAVGVSWRTIWRWVRGQHLPNAAHARKVLAWLNRVTPAKS